MFVINLLQDVSAVRPLAFLAAAELDAPISFLVSHAFGSRDRTGAWMHELRKLAASLDADVATYDSPFAACRLLGGKRGLLVAGSESNVPAHALVHQLFRTGPPGFIKITLQHGFECVGFLQNKEQTASFGADVSFAADIVCSWMPADYLHSLAPSQRSKLIVAGPQALLLKRGEHVSFKSRGGLVCENLHSIRFDIASSRRTDFMADFEAFSATLVERGARVTLRPHPGGQYVLRNAVALAANVDIENRPIYDIDLRDFAFGISAPSTMLLDLCFAGVPVAVWRDPSGMLDTTNYAGLRTVSTVEEWLAFADEAQEAPEDMRAAQSVFLSDTGMLLDPANVRRNYTQLLAAWETPIGIRPSTARRLLLIANDTIPTLDIFFMRPLRRMRRTGNVQVACLTEKYLGEHFEYPSDDAAKTWIIDLIAEFSPTEIIFCRYSGPHIEVILHEADRRGIPTIYHIDDDLLNVPIEFGPFKHEFHNQPQRLDSVTKGLTSATLVYASNVQLMRRLQDLTGRHEGMVAGTISSSAEVRRIPAYRTFAKMGYMGFDHAHDLESILPSLVDFLSRNPGIRFELLGTIPKPAELDAFGDRISVVPPVRDYGEFQQLFSEIDWDIGICPLADTPFNSVKGDVKWLEYTSAGIAVIATRGTIYDACCAEGCGWLATTHTEWVEAFQALCGDVDRRYRQVELAQRRLRERYSLASMERQLLNVIEVADELSLRPAME